MPITALLIIDMQNDNIHPDGAFAATGAAAHATSQNVIANVPAISRLVRGRLLDQRAEKGKAAAQRNVLSLTGSGRAELEQRLREPAGVDITDFSRFVTILAFLALLRDRGERDVVLRRRPHFLEQPASFFCDGDIPLRQRDMADPYRQGLFVIAKATSSAERSWLKQMLDRP